MKKIVISVLAVAFLLMGTVAFATSLTDEQKEFFDFRADRVDSMVQDGRITQDQADEYLNDLEQKLTDGECDQENCTEGEECELNEDGRRQGFGGKGSGLFGSGSFSSEDGQEGNGFCGGQGVGRGCGR